MTVTVSVPGFGSRAGGVSIPDQNAVQWAQAERSAQKVQSLMDEITTRADALSAEAIERIEELAKFQPSTPQIRYNAPDLFQNPLMVFVSTVLPDITDPDLGGVEEFEPEIDDTAMPSMPRINPPGAAPALDFEIPPLPQWDGSQIALPSAPEIYNEAIAAAPVVVIAPGALPDLMPPVLDDADIELDALTPIAPMPIMDIDGEAIDLAFEQLMNALGGMSLTIPDYSPVMGDLVAFGSNLAETRLLPDTAASERLLDVHSGMSARMVQANDWTQRGMGDLDADASMQPFANDIGNLAPSLAARGLAEQRALLATKLLVLGLSLCADAHGVMMDVRGKIAELTFAALQAKAEALLAMQKALVSRANALVAIFNARAETYSAMLIAVRTNAARFDAELEMMEAEASRNTSLADVFSANERTKAVDVDRFKSLGKVEASKVKAFAAYMRSLASRAEAAQGDAEAYRGKVALLLADLEGVKSEYDRYRAEARGVMAQNKGQAFVARQSELENSVIAAQLGSYDATLRAELAVLRGEVEQRIAGHEQTQAHNALENVKADLAARVYDAQQEQAALDALANVSQLEIVGARSRDTVEFYRKSQDGLSRAAQLTQDVRFKVGSALERIYEQVGKTGAALESARMSRFSASLSFGGSTGISAGADQSLRKSYSWENNMRESDSVGQEVAS